MKNTFKLLFVIIVCSFGFLSVYAAKPEQKDCHAVNTLNGGGISILLDQPNPGEITIEVPDLTVVCQHKDGAREPVRLGLFKRVIKTRDAAVAQMVFTQEAMKQGLKTLKTKYCPQHGCNQQ